MAVLSAWCAPKKLTQIALDLLPVAISPIRYPYEVATPTAEMLAAKLLFNSVISTPGARFMTMDISIFYLMTPLLRPEYIRIKHWEWMKNGVV